jgi:ribulose-phosphate 3-epimerase
MQVIRQIRQCNMRVGLALKPQTPVETVYPFLNEIDMVLVMTVEPGFGGQSFMHECMPKVAALRAKSGDIDIQVDGGLAEDTVEYAAKAGANVIVAGTSIFKSSDAAKTIQVLRESVGKYVKV